MFVQHHCLIGRGWRSGRTYFQNATVTSAGAARPPMLSWSPPRAEVRKRVVVGMGPGWGRRTKYRNRQQVLHNIGVPGILFYRRGSEPARATTQAEKSKIQKTQKGTKHQKQKQKIHTHTKAQKQAKNTKNTTKSTKTLKHK